jgi:RHS repeat-associated protein
MFYDGADCVGEDNGTNTRWYITPGLDENLLVYNGSADFFYTQDGLGSVLELINTSQQTRNSYDYEAFGSFYGTPTENVVNRYTFTGREWDSESQSYHYRARQYRPVLARFDARDRFSTFVNLYTYAVNRPTYFRDPTGWKTIVLKDSSLKSDEKIKIDAETDNLKGSTVGTEKIEETKTLVGRDKKGNPIYATKMKRSGIHPNAPNAKELHENFDPDVKDITGATDADDAMKKLNTILQGATKKDKIVLYTHTYAENDKKWVSIFGFRVPLDKFLCDLGPTKAEIVTFSTCDFDTATVQEIANKLNTTLYYMNPPQTIDFGVRVQYYSIEPNDDKTMVFWYVLGLEQQPPRRHTEYKPKPRMQEAEKK